MGLADTTLVGWRVKHLHSEVSSAIDAICELGCTQVTACIKSLQAGESRQEYEHLTQEQCGQLLRELQDIMSVYEQKPCS